MTAGLNRSPDFGDATSGKAFGSNPKSFDVTHNIPCCCHFSAVTEKPSGNSKDTLLISREINNPSANGLEKALLFLLSKHRFPMPKLPKRRKGMRAVCKPVPY